MNVKIGEVQTPIFQREGYNFILSIGRNEK